MDMAFVFVALLVAFLLCFWGFGYAIWKLYLSGRGRPGTAVVDHIIRDTPTYRPVGHQYKLSAHLAEKSKEIKTILSIWSRNALQREDTVPVIVYTGKRGKTRVLAKDSKVLLGVLAFVCGGMALLFALVLLLMIIYR